MQQELSCALVVAAAVTCALVSSVYAQPATQPAAASAANIDSGKAAYDELPCQACHGIDGAGTAAGPRLAASALELPAFISYVRSPTGTMPAQASDLVSDRELAAIYAFLHSAAVREAQAVPAPLAGSVEAGAVLYRQNGCYQCHVEEAQGGPQGPRLGPNPIPMQRFAAYVRNPTGNMPPYTIKVLRDDDLASIYAFLQARSVPPPVASIPLLAP